MNLLTRTAVALGLARAADGDPSAWEADVTPPARSSSTTVTVREALALESVYRALFVIQTAVSQLTIDVWRRDQPLTVTPSLVATPDPGDDQSGWLADTAVSLSARGNAFWRKHRGGPAQDVLSLEVLDPLKVMPFKDKQGRKRYAYGGKDLTPYDVAHLRLLRVPGEVAGLGPIQAAAARLRGSLDVATYSDNWFNRSGVPSGTLNTDKDLTPDQARAWKKQWSEQVKTGETAVLGSGLSYRSIYLTPKEAQWLESQRWSVTTVARMFGIPPRLLMAAIEGDSMTYSNAETEDRQFVKYTLAAYLRPIEQALTDVLPRGQVARFNLDGFLRADTLTRYQAHQIGLEAGFLDVPEVRRIEGLALKTETAPAEEPA